MQKVEVLVETAGAEFVKIVFHCTPQCASKRQAICHFFSQINHHLSNQTLNVYLNYFKTPAVGLNSTTHTLASCVCVRERAILCVAHSPAPVCERCSRGVGVFVCVAHFSAPFEIAVVLAS